VIKSPLGGRSRASRPWRRAELLGAVALLLFLVVVIPSVAAWLNSQTFDPFSDAGDDPLAAYVTVLLLVFGDAIIPVFPGETTVTSAAVVAASGALNIWWVCVAASLGAILGDSAVYWIARSARGTLRHRMEAAAAKPRARQVLRVFSERAPLLIVVGRYVPGFRLVVNFTMGGVVRMAYPRFLRWSALSGALWGFYTGLLAFAIATVFDARPFLSLIISGLVTSVAIAWVMVVLRRGASAPIEAVDASLANDASPAGGRFTEPL
jgi:membrane protein DedA with SNARE-associated domain